MQTKFTILLLIHLCILSTAFEQGVTPKTAWLLKGNSNIDTAINFIGTKDSAALIFKVNGQPSGFLDFARKGNVAYGFQLQKAGISMYNSAFGYQALHNNTSDNNTAVGYRTLYMNTIGDYNTAVGSQALYNNTQGFSNTAVGHLALNQNKEGHDNVAIGDGALTNNVDGRYNIAIGTAALSLNTADNNLAIGYYALNYNTYGIYNTAVGVATLQLNSSGSNNTAVGLNALDYNKVASGNTAYGSFALASLIPGSNNTAIGYAANVSDGGLSNTVALGADAIADNSNTVRIGNSHITSIGGQVEWTSFSDKRIKQNVKEDVPGLLFINKLRPVTYTIDVKREDQLHGMHDSIDLNNANDIEKIKFTGFIAQEVDEAAKNIGYEFSGVDKSGKLMGLRYSTFVIPLVKAVQELSNSNLEKDTAIQLLQLQVNQLTTEVNELKTMIMPGGSISSNNLSVVTGNVSSLAQNIPNPFYTSSVIEYTIPGNCNSAYILISDEKGSVVKRIDLIAKGSSSVTVNRSSLSAGAYTYTLYINSKLIDTKQMVVAN